MFGLYLHIPFCRKKCPYCNFYSTASRKPVPAFLDAIKKEALLYKERGLFSKAFSQGAVFDTIYIGGGTPSVLRADEIEGLLDHIRSLFPLSGDTEITIEANPGDLQSDNLRSMLKSGINRINIGIQSFDTESLKFLGRSNNAEQGLNAFEHARAAGFENIGIDLIYGMPGRSRYIWIEDLHRAIALSPEHIACYQLTIEEGTRFGRMKDQGRLLPVEEAEEYALFVDTSGQLTQAGYLHYEVSNFAKGKGLVSIHNSKYWQHIPYLGLGPSAHSFIEDSRWWNHRSVEMYIRKIGDDEFPIEDRETLTEDSQILETLYFAFRTKRGLDLDGFRRDFGRDLRVDASEILSRLIEEGRVEVKGKWVVPTLEGMAVADSIPLLF